MVFLPLSFWVYLQIKLPKAAQKYLFFYFYFFYYLTYAHIKEEFEVAVVLLDNTSVDF